MKSVADSDTVYVTLYNPSFVLMQYFGYLRRNPDDSPDANFAGYDFWLNKMNTFSRPGENVRDEAVALARVRRAEMVRAFIVSDRVPAALPRRARRESGGPVRAGGRGRSLPALQAEAVGAGGGEGRARPLRPVLQATLAAQLAGRQGRFPARRGRHQTARAPPPFRGAELNGCGANE